MKSAPRLARRREITVRSVLSEDSHGWGAVWMLGDLTGSVGQVWGYLEILGVDDLAQGT